MELSRLYPVSRRSSLKRSISLFLLLCFSVVLFLVLWNGGERGVMYASSKYIMLFLLFIFFIKISFEELTRLSYCYGIEDAHLVITKGIILKRRATYPLVRISDVYLDHSFLDFLFGLCNLHVTTQTAESAAFANIVGLRKSVAISLQEKVASYIDAAHNQVGNSKN